MIVETKVIYKCEFCRKVYQLKKFAIEHELQCDRNPENKRKCNGCNSLSKIEAECYYDSYNGIRTRTVDVLFCDKLKCYIHPLKVELKGNAFDFGDVENIPMKKDCEYFNNDF